MLSTRSGLGLLLFCALPLVAHAASAPPSLAIEVKDTVRRTFTVELGGTFFIDADRGNIEVRMARGNRVEVVVEREADVRDNEEAKRVWERHDLRILQNGADVRVASAFEEGSNVWRRWRGRDDVRVRFIVTVPHEYHVRFDAAAGNIVVEGLGGAVNGRAGAGNIELRGVDGPVEVFSGSGNVEVVDVRRDVRLSTGAGNVRLSNVRGALDVRTGAGNVVAEFPAQPRGSVSLESGAGNVTAEVRPGIGFAVEAGTGIGSASCEFGLEVKGNFMSKTFSGDISGGGPRLALRSGVGNVRLVRLAGR